MIKNKKKKEKKKKKKKKEKNIKRSQYYNTNKQYFTISNN